MEALSVSVKDFFLIGLLLEAASGLRSSGERLGDSEAGHGQIPTLEQTEG